MGYRKMVFTIVLCCSLTETRGAEPADALKQFIESPPVIEQLVFEVSYPDHPHAPSQFYFGRYQEGATLISRCTTKTDAMKNGIDSNKPAVISRIGDHCWKLSGNRVSEWQEGRTPDEAFKFAQAADIYWLTKTLHFGIGRAPIGALKWKHDTIDYDDPGSGFRSEGKLTIDHGRAKQLDLKFNQVTGDSKSFRWRVDYNYSANRDLGHLPTEVQTMVLQDDGKYRRADLITIHKLEISGSKLPKDAFHWQTFTNSTVQLKR